VSEADARTSAAGGQGNASTGGASRESGRGSTDGGSCVSGGAPTDAASHGPGRSRTDVAAHGSGRAATAAAPLPDLTLASDHVPRFLALLEALVTHESPSRDVPRLRAVGDLLADEVARRGGSVERVGENLIAGWAGAQPGERPVLVVGHMDTVHPAGTLARYPYRADGERVRGPGSYDMKAGVATVLEALALLAARGERPRSDVVFFVSCDEEVGSDSSRALIEELARSASAALVVEPCAPGGKIKSRRKGVAWYVLEIGGRAAHAGIEPDAGASAVHELARVILRLLPLADREAGTTINVGVVGGGTRANVVADQAWARVDVRYWTREEALRVDGAIRSLRLDDPRCTLAIEGGIDRMPLEQSPASDRLFEVAREQAALLGFALERTGTGGASDGNLTSGAGCPTIDGLGPDGGGAHTLDEHILLADIPRRIALLAALLRRL
jgi:glutamate carboxypeptidase